MKKILVIEDNTDVRENIAEILELDGYQAIEAENGKIGVQKAFSEHPDFIICDVMMPVLDGFGVLKILNKRPEFAHVPFLFLTAKSEKSDIRRGMGLGADDYLTKPFDDVELLTAIEIRLKKQDLLKLQSQNQAKGSSFLNQKAAEAQLKALHEPLEGQHFNTKQAFFETGNYPKYAYYIEKGLVKTYQINDFGKALITKIYGSGALFGYKPILNNSKYQNHASSLSSCIIKKIPVEDFTNALHKDIHFANDLIQKMAKETIEAEAHLIDIAYSSVRKKVANALLIIANRSNNDQIQVLRDDLAGLAGIAKETVIRTLSDFKKEGIIDISKQQIIILDKIALISMPQ